MSPFSERVKYSFFIPPKKCENSTFYTHIAETAHPHTEQPFSFSSSMLGLLAIVSNVFIAVSTATTTTTTAIAVTTTSFSTNDGKN
jgi:hypothetical protein